jgi:hypothetical protein
MENLLKHLVGDKGLEALRPLLKNETLAAFITPRLVTGWLRKSTYGELKLQPFQALVKTGYGYDGNIQLKEVNYIFEKATEEQVAAMVSVTLEQKVEPTIKDLDLAKLSKTLDLLIKVEPRYEPKEVISTAAPKLEPVEATDKQPPVVNRVQRRRFSKTMLVTDKESKSLCKLCGKSQFDKGEFKGCTCLKSLAKSVKCEVKGCNYLLTFNNDCGLDELMTVAEAIGRI